MDDRRDRWTPMIEASHPMKVQTKEAHDAYATALEMVGNRHSKGALVALVCWLVQRVDDAEERLRTRGVQVPSPALPTDRLEQVIDSYLEDYEMVGEAEDGRDACHVPTEGERILIKDAILGLLANDEWDAAWGELIEQRARERATSGVAMPLNDQQEARSDGQ